MKCTRHPSIDLVSNNNGTGMYCPVCFDYYEKEKNTYPQKVSIVDPLPKPKTIFQICNEQEATIKSQQETIEKLKVQIEDVQVYLNFILQIENKDFPFVETPVMKLVYKAKESLNK